jgi:hypothetical protein
MEEPGNRIGRRVAMAKPLNVQILERARALIANERHWCPGTFARDGRGFPVNPMDNSAEQRCALGALVAAAHELTADPDLAHQLAASAMRPVVGATSLTHINDTEGHAAVLELLDRAIATRQPNLRRPGPWIDAGRCACIYAA